MTNTQLRTSIAFGIATFEGFYNKRPSLAKRNNNPGNIRRWGRRAVYIGDRRATPEEMAKGKGYVRFPRLADGWDALYKQITINIERGLTLREFFGGKPGVYGGYAPAADANKPDRYARFVAAEVAKFVEPPASPDAIVDIPLQELL